MFISFSNPNNRVPRETATSRGDMPPPLRVQVAAGMPIYETWTGTLGTIVGYTQAYCIYRAEDASDLSIGAWHEVALANICPADRYLPRELAEIDLANARAALLREFLAAKPFGLTANQAAAYHELVAILCGVQHS